MRTMNLILGAVAGILLMVGCSSSDPTSPTDTNTTIRLLNCAYDDTLGLDLYVAGRKVISRTAAGKSSGYVPTGANGESVEIAIHYADSVGHRFKSNQIIAKDGSYTAYAIPPARTISISWSYDGRQTEPGFCRIKLVNGVPDAGSLALAYTDEPTFLLGPVLYSNIANYAQIQSGTYAFSVMRSNNTELFAFDSVRLDPQAAYTLVLYGTANESDEFGFAARLFSDAGAGNTYIDLTESPDRGKAKFVHAVPGAPPISVFLDGASIPTLNNLAYNTPLSYIDLSTGSHRATITANGSPILTDVGFGIGKRTKTTLFVTGTTTPPNMSLLELADLKKPHSTAEASLRLVNLCPDCGPLDAYIRTSTGDEKIGDFQNKAFRETSYSNDWKSQFGSRYPAGYRIVIKKAGTEEVVVAPTNVTLLAGKVITLWVGGMSSAATLNTITHE